LRKVKEGLYDAIILAAAGLHRMGWQDRITVYLDPEQFVPAIGQGAIGIETRRDDDFMIETLSKLHHAETAIAVEAERSLLKELEGGCQVPIGGYARILNEEIHLDGLVASLDGAEVFRLKDSGKANLREARELGRALAQNLLKSGAKRVLEEIYGNTIGED
jgi:hydroxymethylbilane synthase